MMQGLRRNALYIGNLVGIPIFLHWTCLLLCYSAWKRAGGAQAGLDGFILVLIALVLSILLHELGHGLMARRLGAYGLTITLWAFGGLCESRRDNAHLGREIAIVAAGPAVSLGLWLAALATWNVLALHAPAMLFAPDGGDTLLAQFLWTMESMNLMLLIFNMLPIFPLDGGQLTFYVLLLVTRRPLLARQISLCLAVLGAAFVFAWATGLFSAMATANPTATWLAMLAANPLSAVILAVMMLIILRSSFTYLS